MVAALTPRIAPPIDPPMAAPAAPRMRVAMSGSQHCGNRKARGGRHYRDYVSQTVLKHGAPHSVAADHLAKWLVTVGDTLELGENEASAHVREGEDAGSSR